MYMYVQFKWEYEHICTYSCYVPYLVTVNYIMSCSIISPSVELHLFTYYSYDMKIYWYTCTCTYVQLLCQPTMHCNVKHKLYYNYYMLYNLNIIIAE